MLSNHRPFCGTEITLTFYSHKLGKSGQSFAETTTCARIGDPSAEYRPLIRRRRRHARLHIRHRTGQGPKAWAVEGDRITLRQAAETGPGTDKQTDAGIFIQTDAASRKVHRKSPVIAVGDDQRAVIKP